MSRWLRISGGADLEAEAAAWLERNGRRQGEQLRDPLAAWEGWLKKCPERAAARSAEIAAEEAANTPPPSCGSCSGGWLPEDDDERPVPCPRCRPHLRSVEAS